MAMIEKIIKDDKRYIKILNLCMPYHIEKIGEAKCIKALGLSFTYYRDVITNDIYLKLFGQRLYLSRSRRVRHYHMRNQLTDKKCIELLTKELTPLLGYQIDLKNPKTFNEKINWLKIYNKDDRITTCCDKYAVKDYAAQRIGQEYVVPTLATWNSVDEVNLDDLPQQFVLKVNWSSGFNIIVKDKNQLDFEEVKEKLKSWTMPYANSYYDTFNWGYKNMKPVIYAEKYIEQMSGQVYDYKFYFSKGKFIYMFIATDRHNESGLTYTFFDENLQPYPFTYGKKPNANPIPMMPKQVDKMLKFAKILADDFSFVRVDFYEINEEDIYLGEMTFYSGGGTLRFNPLEWDRRLGDKIQI